MTGQLLIAHPLLNDGFFNRSVIHLSQYSEEGVVGFILNFKTQFKLRDVRPQVINGNFPIYEGGPVAKNQLFFIHTLGDRVPDAIHVKDNFYFGGDFNQLLYLIDHEHVTESQVRFFAGYSGWDIDQLKGEIEKDSWFVYKSTPTNILSVDPYDMWGMELSKEKESYKVFGDFGFDPSTN